MQWLRYLLLLCGKVAAETKACLELNDHSLVGTCKNILARPRLLCEVLSRLAELCGLRAIACAAAEVSVASMARRMRMAAAAGA